jgi:putative tryptophan/tyrosine transport system substrate-binding protein
MRHSAHCSVQTRLSARLALLKEVLPSAKRIAVIANPSHPGEHKEWAESEKAVAKLGLTLQHFPVQTESELDSALAEVAKSHIDAVLVFSDGFALDYARRIAAFSAQQRIPTIAGWAPFAQRGNLLVYGPVFADVYRRLATYVDRIRKGAKPGDLPIEQPTKLELLINLKTAKSLGIVIPQSLLVRADDVIQ